MAQLARRAEDWPETLRVITNLNARVCTDGTIFVQYQEEGRAKDGSFPTWWNFIQWLELKLCSGKSSA